MIGDIIKLLQNDDYYSVSDTIEIAKGRYEIPDTFKKTKVRIKREIKIKLHNGREVRNRHRD